MHSTWTKWTSRCVATLLLITSTSRLAADTQGPTPFKAGDRVCYIGDSITHGGGYHAQILLFYATRFPQIRFESWNCGVSGDSAAGAVSRYDWDIAPRKPTVAAIMFGMNDVQRSSYDRNKTSPEIEAAHLYNLKMHVEYMTKLADRLSHDGASLIFLTPSIYDQTGTQATHNNYGVNDALKICGDEARKLATKYKGSVVDFHDLMTDLNAKLQTTDPNDTLVGPDRIHPGAPGHLVMAYAFLKAQGMTPTVSSVAIEVGKDIPATQDNCQVSNLSAKPDAVSFDLLENALPFPVDDKADKALHLVPFIQDLNQETVTIRGLSEGSYDFLIDGTSIGHYRADELKTGINLATVKETPQYKQAVQVKNFIDMRAYVFWGKLRDLTCVRLFLLSKYPNRTPAEEEKIIAANLEKNRKENNQYGVAQLEGYQKTVKEEAQLNQDAATYLENAYLHAKPKSHHYEIKLAH